MKRPHHDSLSDSELAGLVRDALPAPPEPWTAAEARARFERRTRAGNTALRGGAAAAVIVVLGVGLLLLSPAGQPELRARSAGRGEGQVLRLEAVLDRPGNAPLQATGPAAPVQEGVLFVVAVERSEGYLCLEEEDSGTWHRISSVEWPARAGRQPMTLGDGRLAVFHTELGPGRRSYRVLWDRESPNCSAPAASAERTLVWR